MESFTGKIKRVYQNIAGIWFCDIYATENQSYNGIFKIKEDIIEEARELSRVPQKDAMITENGGYVIREEDLE